MDISSIIYYIILPLVGVIIVPYVRSLDVRIRSLENELTTKVNDAQVRQLVKDRYDPLDNKLQALDNKLDKIYDYLLTGKQEKQ